MNKYVQIILPLRLKWTPWYSCEESPSVGDRVLVRFAGKEYAGVVFKVSENPEIDPSKIKPIVKILDGFSPISTEELSLWSFISEYYLCTIGEVYKAAYPTMKIKSEKTAADAAARSRLSEERIRLAMVARVERLSERLAAKKEEFSLKRDGTKIKEALRLSIEKTEQELDAARKSLETSRNSRNEPSKHTTGSGSDTHKRGDKPVLVCGNDRLQLYSEKISACLEDGLDALVLVPESNLGDSLEKRLSDRFSGRITVFNSKMSQPRRRQTAASVRDTCRVASVIIGTRIALFLPFSKLGLIIVDEEQDSSYKQTEPAPRYNARDCAVILGRIHGAEVLLGSSFPSFESLNNSIEGKYLRLELKDTLPAVEIIDIGKEKRKHGMDSLFSFKMIEAIRNFPGPVAIVRGWEKEQEVNTQLASLFPGKEIEIVNPAAARSGIGKDRLCAVLQADAFFEKDKFRSDEHCLQQLSQFRQNSAAMLVQTAKSSHPVFETLSQGGKESSSRMLEERRLFSLPPYSRIIDLQFADCRKADELQGRLAVIGQQSVSGQTSSVSIQRTGPTTIRVLLPRDSYLKQRKAAIAGLAWEANAIADVDPL